MPSLGADMQFGTIVDWRVKPGDAVKRGDVVALVETEKGVIEVEIFESGVIESLVVQPGQKVPVGTTLATLSGGRQESRATTRGIASRCRCSGAGGADAGRKTAGASSVRGAAGRSGRLVCAFRRWRENAPRNSASIYPALLAAEATVRLPLQMSNGRSKAEAGGALRPRRLRLARARVWI